ncbi:phosphotransferase family protein [Streptomyces sp. PSKA54]|uniref:Phosphotransferase family protein n=1 Tax=Streptomyces himalayensis subsp. aureolus TaxID=2758039 RepID=A0A7W2D1C5_9ACTN|nr:phosphotransferase family protein [Streptomyces himalayensis]MBA4862826.1 phosphotransferase family protein [Streptomyces himalayensis subsp. aureolus]
MSDAPVFAKGRDLDAAAAALRPWLAARLGVADVDVTGMFYPQGAGVSNETILFEARTGDHVDELVLRVAPAREHQMFLEPRFRLQYDILAALRRLGSVRVPEALWYEDDPAVLGRPFYLMRRMRGRVPVSMPVYNASGWLAEATPAQRRVLWDSAMRQFAAIHRVPVAEVPFVDLPDHGATGDEQQLAYWSRFATWALGDDIPEAVHALLDWLTAHRPPASVPGLSWGDARIGNMMFGDDFHVVGVMDWEQASLAGPMADLGWWLLFDDIHSVEHGVARLDGLGTRQETLDRWQELTGRQVESLHWHEVFAGLKAGLLGLHTRRSMKLPNADERANPFLQRSCRMLDLTVAADLS